MENSTFTNTKMNLKLPGLIVCGTDTDVGKTVASAFLLQGLKATYWKPIQSGIEDGGDRGRVAKIVDLPKEHFLPEAYVFNAAVSPHWAAEKENRIVSHENLNLPQINNFLILETAGGLLVPLNRNLLQIDQVKIWSLPVVLVCRSGLGTLNHTLLSIEALKKRRISILGLIINGPEHLDNPKTIVAFSNIPIICKLPYFEKLNAYSLREEWNKQKLDKVFIKLFENFSSP